METLELARWQFAATTIYHFLFVPLTLGLSVLVAGMQTAWHRTGNPTYYRMTRFWGKLLLVNFALGVVTGIVQEFQFGMAWSGYSRYVGDIFGAPLAMEGLIAFFLESTFLGLWMFGWDRLPKRIHLATAWLFAIGSWFSAYFILAANSWMQHPVGYTVNPVTNRAELTSIWEVLTNSTAIFAFFHTMLGGLATAGSVIVGISIWHLHKARRTGMTRVEAHAADAREVAIAEQTGRAAEVTPGIRRAVFRRSARLGLITMLAATFATTIVGHFNAQLMTEQQPMKMASAEALWETREGAPLSLLTIAPFEKNPERPSVEIAIPYLASFLATDDPNGVVRGINDVQAELEQKYGPGEYYPIVGLTYWSFRLMIGMGMVMLLLGTLGLLLWKRRLYEKRWVMWAGLFGIFAGFGAHAFGWTFTEAGRQPWVVYGLQKTADGVSQLAPSTVLTSLVVFVLLYGALAIVEFRLFVRFAKRGPEADHHDDGGERQLAIQY